MTGFRKKKTLYKLVFEDPDLDGLEVVGKGVSVDQLLELQRLQQTADTNAEDAEKVMRKLANAIDSWNLEDDDGAPVPCTFDGLKTQEMSFVLAIFSAWRQAVASVPNPSPNGSNDGGTSLEQSIPMEVSSPNP